MVRSYRSQIRHISKNVKLFLIGNAIQAAGLSIYGLLFNFYLKELGFKESAIGGLISTTSLGISLMALPAALIIEKFHVKNLVMTGLFFSSLFYFLQVLHIEEGALFSFGVLASMFQALFNISVSPFYLRNSTPAQRVHLFTLNSSLNMVAHLVGYFLGGHLPDFISFLAPQLGRVEIYRFSLILALSVVFSSNLVFLGIKKVPIPRSRKSILLDLKEREWKILGKLIVPKLFFAFGGGLIIPFINLYLKERFSFSTEMVGISYALLQFFIFWGILITPMIISKTTHLRFIVLTGSLSIPFMLAMGLVGNVGLVLGCFFLRGMLMNMSGPIMSMFEMERVRESDCVFASATILFCYHIVYTTSTRIGGFLIENYSFTQTFYVAGSFYAIATILYYALFKKEDDLNATTVTVSENAA